MRRNYGIAYNVFLNVLARQYHRHEEAVSAVHRNHTVGG